MLTFLAARLGRMLVTPWIIAAPVILATRAAGNPIDVLMPQCLDAESRNAVITPFGLDQPLSTQDLSFWRSLWGGEGGLA